MPKDPKSSKPPEDTGGLLLSGSGKRLVADEAVPGATVVVEVVVLAELHRLVVVGHVVLRIVVVEAPAPVAMAEAARRVEVAPLEAAVSAALMAALVAALVAAEVLAAAPLATTMITTMLAQLGRL